MTAYNKNSGWGNAIFSALLGSAPTTGQVMFVMASTDTNYNDMAEIIGLDPRGKVRIYSTIALALAACGTNTGDMVLISPGFTTAPTLAELASAATQGVIMQFLGGGSSVPHQYAILPATALPASGYGVLFTVTAPVRLLDIQGEVTTAIQAQANATKITATPTVGSAVDLCATLDINGYAVGRTLNITGTLATAMISTNANGVMVAQAAAITVPAGTIGLTTAATNTGAVKWVVRYIPLVPGAAILPV